LSRQIYGGPCVLNLIYPHFHTKPLKNTATRRRRSLPIASPISETRATMFAVVFAGVASSHSPRFSFSSTDSPRFSTDSPRLSVTGRSPQPPTQSLQRLRGGSVAAITLAEELQLCLNLLQAAVLGSVIGVERGWAGRPAGIRTMSMVCMGAALFTGVAELVQQNPPQPEREPKPEPAP